MPQCEIVEKKYGNRSLNTQDSVTVVATTLYRGGLIKKMFQGRGYRKAWETPITVPMVRLDTLFGGLEPIEKGGGEQTQSLELHDAKGNAYTLRSVNKDPRSLVPDFAEKLRIGGIVTDGISAQHPYGALVVPPMQDALGLWHTAPRTIFVAPQEALDSFNLQFQNRIYFIEYETSGNGEWTGLDNIKEITSTEGIQKLDAKHDNFEIDTANLVRARLFDLVIGDWDRHAKNWGWVVTETDDKILATVMACDRDNTFYGIGGVIPWFINRPFMMPLLRPFKKRIDYLPGMIKPFDSYFLLGVPESVYQKEAAYIKTHLTDEVIEDALRVWPDELYDIDAKRISKKIKARRDKLHRYARKFPKILDKRGPLEDPLKGSTKFWEKQTGKKSQRKRIGFG